MLTIGRQLKAARALAGVSQKKLATIAGVSANTIGAMERAGIKPFRADFGTVQSVQRALEGIGVELLDNRPGARLRYEARDQ
jgi:transcriptional regulator with XRE-family HTH domain